MTQPYHHHPIRVYYEDTDAGGIVYHASYLRYCERARAEMLRASGCNNAQFVARTGLQFVVRQATLDYHKPAKLDDALEVVTSVKKIGGASAVLQQDIMRDGVTIVAVTIVLVCVEVASARPERIPDDMRLALGVFMNNSE
jgi:acyl-CoA thioester hydrolase